MYVSYFVFWGRGGITPWVRPPPRPLRRWAQKLHTYGRIRITRDMYIRAAGLESEGGGGVVFFDEKLKPWQMGNSASISRRWISGPSLLWIR